MGAENYARYSPTAYFSTIAGFDIGDFWAIIRLKPPVPKPVNQRKKRKKARRRG